MIGTINITRTIESGNFHCPSCRSSQNCRIRSRRPFLTLYFIPVCPIGPAEAFVQCGTCRASWDPSVLAAKPIDSETQLIQFREDALRTAILITLADGTITEDEIEALMQVARDVLERPLDREELGRLCASAQRLNISPSNFVLTAKTGWSKDQALLVLQAAFLSASAGGTLNQSQMEQLSQLRELLELADDEYRIAIEEAVSLS